MKISRARQKALEDYGKTLKNYRRKLKRLENNEIDFSQWFDIGLGLREVKEFSTIEIKTLTHNMKDFTKRGGEKIIKYNKNYVPQAFKSEYQRALKRYNSRKKQLERYRLNKIKKPPESIVNFQSFASKVIYKASPQYALVQKNLYKANYLKAITNSLSVSENYEKFLNFISSISSEKLISIYYTKGKEDLTLQNIYPGNPDEADDTIQYLTERWREELKIEGEWDEILEGF